jgi:hypothetical protein
MAVGVVLASGSKVTTPVAAETGSGSTTTPVLGAFSGLVRSESAFGSGLLNGL